MERFEELSTEIMELLRAQLNALDRFDDFGMTTLQLRECAEREGRILRLNRQLGKFRRDAATKAASAINRLLRSY